MDCTLCNGSGRIVFVEFDTRAVLPCPVCGEAAAEARRYRLAREQMAREFGTDRQRREIAAKRLERALTREIPSLVLEAIALEQKGSPR